MPVISAADFTALLRAHDFARLFGEHLGWDNVPRNTPNVQLNAPGATGPEPFVFQPVKVKHGFMVLSCPALPTKAQRQRLSLQMSKRYAEHLLVYAPAGTGEAGQLWQLVVRDPGEPVRFFEFPTNTAAQRENLRRRVEGLYIDFEEEAAGLTLTQVREKNRRAFALNAEKVTKKFYAEFSRQHQAFQALIKGIEGSADRAWYTSIMLNRLMFIYFVQAQGYLLVSADGPTPVLDQTYLKHKLEQCAELLGPDKFESFYRSFLRVLFSEGLNAPLPHAPALAALLGRVPYLNGGLFEEHELERAHPAISIPDQAFEHLFGFLSKWDWILDSRHQATGTTINPDVIGYIFERYINERAQMGAYYTKEDITEYIAKNCLIPALFDRMSERGARHESEVWDLLQDYPDRYLYPAQRKGLDLPLPADIEAGRTDMAARAARWNRPTPNDGPDDYGLPTEIWRETIQRRDRATAARARLLSGQVRSINELITLNLDLRQFLHDAIANAGNAEWVWACFESLRSLSILDPTCGSGAFLFAALRLLEPLYQDCLDRMEAFLPELDNPKTLRVKKEVVRGMQQVRRELVENHLDNRAYFITKTIILHNLYGVDLMHEAVEIAKLRLFLQLMSTLEAPDYDDANLGLEPLPDVDFNIRAGNTLVGFATRAELQKGLDYTLDGRTAEPEILEQADVVAHVYAEFKHNQDTDDQAAAKTAKAALQAELNKLNKKLNTLLHKQNTKVSYDEFCQRYQPFHWFAEFYEIVTGKGGFDLIIGNPPYVEYSKVSSYKISNYETLASGDLYAFTMERAFKLVRPNARFGMIVPISIFGVDGFQSLQKNTLENLAEVWVSSFANRPSQVFEGAQKRVTIVLGRKGRDIKNSQIFTSPYIRFGKNERDFLTDVLITYNQPRSPFSFFSTSLQKAGTELAEQSFNKITSGPQRLAQSFIKASSHPVFYTRAFGYFNGFFDLIPVVKKITSNAVIEPTELKRLYCQNAADATISVAILSSSSFYFFLSTLSDCRNLNLREIQSFPIVISELTPTLRNALEQLGREYLLALRRTSHTMIKSGLEIETFDYSSQKSIIDQIDTALAKHYNFLPDELDFIINYDIKYRMGAELDDEE